MTIAAETYQEKDSVPCWCCGNQHADDQVVRLGRHPEVAVCIGCARYLNRRANERGPATAATRRLRGVAEAARQAVIRRNIQEKPVIGPALRWLDRHLPW